MAVKPIFTPVQARIIKDAFVKLRKRFKNDEKLGLALGLSTPVPRDELSSHVDVDSMHCLSSGARAARTNKIASKLIRIIKKHDRATPYAQSR